MIRNHKNLIVSCKYAKNCYILTILSLMSAYFFSINPLSIWKSAKDKSDILLFIDKNKFAAGEFFTPISEHTISDSFAAIQPSLPFALSRPLTVTWTGTTWQVGTSAPASPAFIWNSVNGVYGLNGTAVPLSSLFTLSTSATGRTYTDSQGIIRDAVANTWRQSYDIGQEHAFLGTMVETYQQAALFANLTPAWRGTATWASNAPLSNPSSVPGLYTLYQGASSAGVYKANEDASGQSLVVFGNAQGSFYTPYTVAVRVWIPSDAFLTSNADVLLRVSGTNWVNVRSSHADLTKRNQWQLIYATGQQVAAQATAVATLQSGVLTGVPVQNSGLGYAAAPTVTVNGCTTAPTATAVLNGSAVAGINVTSGGSGCLANTTITLAPPAAQTLNAIVSTVGGVAADYAYLACPELKTGAVPGSFVPVPNAATVFASADVLTPVATLPSILNGGTLSVEGIISNPSAIGGSADATLTLEDTAGQGNAVKIVALGDPLNPTLTASAAVGGAQVGPTLTGGPVVLGAAFHASLAMDHDDMRFVTQDGASAAASQIPMPADIQQLSLSTNATLYLRSLEFVPGRLSDAVLRSHVQASGPCGLAVSSSSTGVTIPLDFLGFSFETSAVQQSLPLSANAGLSAILNPFKPNISIRFGGNTSDYTNFAPDLSRVTDAANFVANLGAGSSMIWGLNWQANNTSVSSQQAAAVIGVLGTARSKFQIGNEPDYYSGVSFSSYQSRWQSIHDAVASANTGVVFAGPDIGQLPDLYPQQFASALGSQVSMITKHLYPYFYTRKASIDQRQQIAAEFEDHTVDYVARSIAGIANGAGLKVRLTESGTNPNVGIGNTLGAADLALYEMMMLAENGWAGVNFHWTDGLSNVGYTPAFRNGDSTYTAQPLLYAMVMFKQLTGGTVLSSSSMLPANLPTLAVRGADGVVRILIVNKHTTRVSTVNLTYAGTWSMASINLLTGVSYISTSVTLNRTYITSAGGWSQTPITVTKTVLDVIPVAIPPASAVLVELQ